MLTEKEKVEEELKLLEESFSLDVITRQEYEDARQRIESKLNVLTGLKQKSKEPSEENPWAREEEETEEWPNQEKEAENSEITEIEEDTKLVEEEKEEFMRQYDEEYASKEKSAESIEEGLADDEQKEEEIEKEELAEEEQKRLEEDEQAEEQYKEDSEDDNKESLASVPKPEDGDQQSVFNKGKKGSKKIFVYLAIVLILGFGSWYFFYSGGLDGSGTHPEIGEEHISLIACDSDDECAKEGSIGICNDPGTEDAKCEYANDVKVSLMVLNSNSCFNCDSGRVLSILNSFFPNMETQNIDFETEEGKEIVDKYGIIALPAYIFNSSLSETNGYYKLYNAFSNVGSSYVMKNTVSNANYYIKREEMPNKLELFSKQGQEASLIAEENLKEFLEAFDGKVDFEKHSDNSQVAKELGINTFPTFLVNNKIKFSGVQAADKIRENFCQLNNAAECASELTKSLV